MANRTLRVCPFVDLPAISERDTSYLYLAYDKLLLFFGQNQYNDPYVICDEIPSTPITGCLYIVFDGTVRVYVNGNVVTIAEIEKKSQIDHLIDMSTTYFDIADEKYLDNESKTLLLSYRNSMYSISMDDITEITDNTILSYDKSSKRFFLDQEDDEEEDLISILEAVNMNMVNHIEVVFENEETQESLGDQTTESLQALWGGF